MSVPANVVCTGDGLLFGYIKYPIKANIDTTNAGPGELTVYCKGPNTKAFCELREEHNGTFTVIITAREVGLHKLHIQFDEMEVPGSPFALRVSAAGYIKVHGPGLMDNLYRNASGDFLVNTDGAGEGDLKVRVHGPKGKFQVRTEKRDRAVRCSYHPTYPGFYTVQILWDGDHVPGSPFKVYLSQTEDELKYHITRQAHDTNDPLHDIAL